MSEEELEILEILINRKDIFYLKDRFDNIIRPLIGKLLNLYQKIEQENEELHKEINQRIKIKIENEKIVDKDFISKDKIREKIKELKYLYNNPNEAKHYESWYRIRYEFLQELLEE